MAFDTPIPACSVLMVCMGNICRSPTAEAVLRYKLLAAGLEARVRVASAGTHDYHVGSPADRRAATHAAKRGYDLSRHRAAHVRPADFQRHDLLLAMDWDNLALLQESCPPEQQRKLRRLLEFAPDAGSVVPDPYYGGPAAFEHALDLIEAGCVGLVNHLQARLGQGR